MIVDYPSNDLFVFFDTETTGNARNFKAPMTDFTNWPRMVQLAFILGNKSGEIILMQSFLIKPINFVIPDEATAIHGITTQRALEEGVFLQEALNKFCWVCSVSGNAVCQNYPFDSNILGCECLRSGMDTPLKNKKSWCTMDETKEFVGIPNQYGYKWPQLRELHIKLFDKSFEEAHDALSDIKATTDCFFELMKKGILKDR